MERQALNDQNDQNDQSIFADMSRYSQPECQNPGKPRTFVALRGALVVAVAALLVASASASAYPTARSAGVCRVPRLRGLTLAIARTRATHAGCKLRLRGTAPEDAGVQTVERQSPRARAHSSGVTVWLSSTTVKTGKPLQTGQAPQGSAPPQTSPRAEERPPCAGEAAYGPNIEEPLITPGPTELVSGFYLVGGPIVLYSAPNCERLAPLPGPGTVEVMNASGAVVARQSSSYGSFIEIPLPPGSYTITGTFLEANSNDGHPQQTAPVVIPAGSTVRQDLFLNIP